jgi:hypothetical protein
VTVVEQGPEFESQHQKKKKKKSICKYHRSWMREYFSRDLTKVLKPGKYFKVENVRS